MESQNFLETKFFKVLKWTSITVLSLLLVFWLLNTFYLGINLNHTFNTTYGETADGRYSIKTPLFYLETPDRWVHISERDYEIGFWGYFLTPKGKVNYSYDRFNVRFEEALHDSLHHFNIPEFSPDSENFKVDSSQSTKWKYYTVVFPDEEVMGFQIPAQKKLKFAFTFGPDKGAYKYRNELHQTMNTIDIFLYVDKQYEQE